jgi:integrating conjugative element protein (TIGR03752 family)
MQTNALLKWLVPAALLVVVVILLKQGLAGSGAPLPAKAGDQGDPQLSAEQAKSLGIAGDTPRDTVATLVGQVKAMRSDMLGLKKHNDSLLSENHRLRERENSVDSRIQIALSSVTQQVDEGRRQFSEAQLKAEQDNRQARSLLAQLQHQLTALSGKGETMPIGLGLEPGDGVQLAEQPSANETLHWIEPADVPFAHARNTNENAATSRLPNAFNALESVKGTAADRSQNPLRAIKQGEQELRRVADRSEGVKPRYTLPENATLVGSVAMTALIGRVPVDGTVNDPYPFKVLVGPENLTANGIDLPDVAGAVMSGTASGDWTLSCVRGQVESITFVFTDGTIRTVPQPKAVVSRNASTPQSPSTDKIRGGLGYLSDPYGIPCIAGERRSNAQQYLGSQGLITAAGAGVAALLGDEHSNSSVITAGNSAIGATNSMGNSALNAILSGGISDIRAWVNKLYGEAFAAVYVPPAAQVALHLDHEITIDYEPHGRSVRHEKDPAPLPDLD